METNSLENIHPKPNLVIWYGSEFMVTISHGSEVLVVYQDINDKVRKVLWDKGSLLDFCENEFLTPGSISRVVDFNLAEDNIVYQKQKLSKEEVSERLGIPPYSWSLN